MGLNSPGDSRSHAIVLWLGYGTSVVNVFRVGRRLILNNGFHRLYALRSLGFRYAPAVVQHVTHPEIELPSIVGELPRDHLVRAPRPGLMGDFFRPELCCEVTKRRLMKSVQIAWIVNEVLVPA